MTFLRGHSDVLERQGVENYARGLSTRDIEDALQDATGDRLLSRTAVSQLTEVLWAEYEAFRERDLSGFEVEHMFLDVVCESLRHQGGGTEGMLCFWAFCAERSKVLLLAAPGSYQATEADLCHPELVEGLALSFTMSGAFAPWRGSEWREGILTVVGETFSPCLDRPTHNGIKELDKKTETVYNSRYQTHGSPRV